MTPDGPHIGSLNAEAGLLLDAVAARLNKFKTAVGESDLPEEAAAGHDPAHSCVRWCPICRATELLAGDRPDIADKLADAALLVVGTLHALLAGNSASAGDPAPADSSAGPESSATRTATRTATRSTSSAEERASTSDLERTGCR
jgi:hypothetical protein